MRAMTALRRHHLVVTIAGTPTDAFEADAQHGVNQPIGTASVTIPLPVPAHLKAPGERILNAPLTILAGFEDGAIRPIFSGRIDSDRFEMDAQSRSATLSARGWATLLAFEEERDLIFPGPIKLEEIIRSLCRWRRVPSFRIDRITFPDGITDVRLGGNTQIDEGRVVIPKRTSPLAWIDRKLRLFGYRIFDTPSGELRVQRVSGLPTGTAAAHYEENVNLYRFSRGRDLAPMVTYWRMEGPTFTDKDGVSIPIISEPANVPPTPLLTPPGYRSGRDSDSDLVTIALATAARNVAEIDTGAPYVESSWETRGDPWRQPGEVVYAASETFDSRGLRWLMSLRQRSTVSEYTAEMSAWAGAGSPLAAGDDAVSLLVGAGPYHVGDEYLSHYAKPSPNGTSVTVSATAPDEYTSIAISGFGHGINSGLVDGANAESTVSKVEVWQNGERVGSADLPVMPENLLSRLPYGATRPVRLEDGSTVPSGDYFWTPFRMPVPGGLEPGPFEVRLVSGIDKGFGQDDFEVKGLTITLRGVGMPTLPRIGVT